MKASVFLPLAIVLFVQTAGLPAQAGLRLPITEAITPRNLSDLSPVTDPIGGSRFEFSADGRYLLIGGATGAWFVTELRTGLVVPLELPAGGVATIHPRGESVAAASERGLTLAPLSAGTASREVLVPKVVELAFLREGGLVTLESDGRLSAWNLTVNPATFSGTYLSPGEFLVPGSPPVVRLGDSVLAIGEDGRPTGDGLEVAEPVADVEAASGRTAVLTTTGRLFVAESGSIRRVPGSYPGSVVALHPGGLLAAVGSDDGGIAVVDAVEGSALVRLDTGAPVEDLVFSPDGHFLASIGGGGAVLWGVERRVNTIELLSYTYGTETTRRVLARANAELASGEVTMLEVFLRRGVVETGGEFLDLPLATSFLAEAGDLDLYAEGAALDGDLASSWVEGVPGPGIGESFAVPLANPAETAFVEIFPGWGQEAFFRSNHRIRRAAVSVYESRFSPATGLVALRSRVYHREFEVADEPDFVRVPLGLGFNEDLEPAPGAAYVLVLTILDVYRGSRFDDLCIAEIRILDEAGRRLPVPFRDRDFLRTLP